MLEKLFTEVLENLTLLLCHIVMVDSLLVVVGFLVISESLHKRADLSVVCLTKDIDVYLIFMLLVR